MSEGKGKKKKLSKAGSIILDIILAAAVGAAVFSGWHLFTGLKTYREADETYSEVRKETEPEEPQKVERKEDAGRDWEALKKINPDIAAWITLPDSNIDYPVVYADDNEYWLNHLFNGNENAAGTIFIDCENSRNFADRNTVLYGHHMANGAMFNNVENYQDPSYYATHKVISIETPEQNYELYPVAGVLTNGTAGYVRLTFSSDEDFLNYVNGFVAQSTFTSEATVTASDHIVLLSTCSDDVVDGRFIVIGKLVPVNQAG
jgi:sortase B